MQDRQSCHLTKAVKSAIYSLLLASPVLALPEGYEISTWAEPFEIEYPTAITAAADGTVYVSCDRNGSLGALDTGSKSAGEGSSS